MKNIYIGILSLIIIIFGCRKKTQTESMSVGLISVTDPYVELIQEEANQYTSLYPNVKIEVYPASTREAIVQLLNDSIRTIVVDRPFNEEEKQVVDNASITIRENIIAKDGIAIITNLKNPAKSIAFEKVQKLLAREILNWNEVDKNYKNDLIDIVLTGRNTGIYELLQKNFFSFKELIKPTILADNQKQVIEYVSIRNNAIGFISASLAYKEKKKVNILAVTVQSDKGENQYLPGQQEIHLSLYPFKYSLYLYSTEKDPAISLGFSAMILSNIGQKLVQNAGLVPAVIPYRSIQLKSE